MSTKLLDLPVIDIAPFRHGGSADRDAVARPAAELLRKPAAAHQFAPNLWLERPAGLRQAYSDC